jgi:hypothetical protein
VILDSSLKDANWYIQLIQQIRLEHKCFKVAMIHVTCSECLLVPRVKEQARETHREFSEDDVFLPLQYIHRSIELVKPVVDNFFVIWNDVCEGDPQLKDATWEEFTTTFSQSLPGLRRSACRTHARRSFRLLSFEVSTEENHKSLDGNYYGKFVQLRKSLDYTVGDLHAGKAQAFGSIRLTIAL